MVEVHPVADDAQSAQWLDGEQRTDGPRSHRGRDHQHDQRGMEREPSAVEPLVVLRSRHPDDAHDDQCREPGPREERRARTAAGAAGAEGDDGEQRAGEQLHCAGVGAVVDAPDVATGVPEDEHQGDRDRGQGSEHDEQCRTGPATDRDNTCDHNGEGGVELLLDRQRPEVLHGRGLGEQVGVGVAREHESPVGHVRQRGQYVAAQGTQLVGVGYERAEEHDAPERQHGRREQAAEPSGPEGAQTDATRGRRLCQQQGGDEEARQREERAHPQEPAPRPAEAGVKGEHGPDGHATKAVERGFVAQPGPATRDRRARGAGAVRRCSHVGSQSGRATAGRSARSPQSTIVSILKVAACLTRIWEADHSGRGSLQGVGARLS